MIQARWGRWLAVLAASLPAHLSHADAGTSVKFIPLPLYATNPNEGGTYGVMPVFLGVDRALDRTRWIVAPSASWNDVVHLTGTFRGYLYPTDTRAFTLIASGSTDVNRSVTFDFVERSRARGRFTTTLVATAKQNVFFRFYGLGPLTRAEDRASYTRRWARLFVRQGWNVREGLNLAVVLEGRADEPRGQGVPGLPLATERYADVPGMQGAAIATQGISLTYDSRQGGDYAESGLASEMAATYSQGLSGSPGFARVVLHNRVLVPEFPWLQGAARLYVERVFGEGVPFLYQSTLGGEQVLRGFSEGRFVDRGAWTIDVEQRLRVLQMRLFGVTADWRIDAFGSVGQVFHGWDDAFGRVRRSVGLGFRTLVRPNVLGRVDVAYAGEGLNAYVVLGYPF